jgi:hypothetical protein
MPIAKDYEAKGIEQGEGCARARARGEEPQPASQFISLRFDNKDGSRQQQQFRQNSSVNCLGWTICPPGVESGDWRNATLQRVRMNFNHKNSWCRVVFISIEAATAPLFFYHISLDIIQNARPHFSFCVYI